ncbi:hypothetical protein [Microvirga sp. M2]|uniref:hypothetical protein n=1 Tax=Microvirga sp. M2 TaxID=3073270 RepID=UPI0039C25F9C
MLVYGDVESIGTVRDRQQAIGILLDRVNASPPGSERHAALVAAFIGASELIRAIIDADFQEHGFDTLSPAHVDGMEGLSLLARTVVRSWRSGFSQAARPDAFRSKLLSFDPTLTIRTKQAEGYAFYALYPESYVEAATRSGLGPETRVIGIRSIGAGLAALVAEALGARPPFTVRPIGHPFQRDITVDPSFADTLMEERDTAVAVVDEGPGLSGSSFGAVADWLESIGISRDRIHFFPSHSGALGPKASLRHRERWNGASRHVVGMDELLCGSADRLRSWVETVVGPLKGELEDVSGGAWRTLRYADRASWPAANIQQERRKFLARTEGATWLVKFAGLGESGVKKHARALQLHQAGFTPEIAGSCHGFLIERWHGDAPSLDRHAMEPADLVNRIGTYLGFRARHCPARTHEGASLAALRAMALHNAAQALGEPSARTLDRALPDIEPLSDAMNRVFTDNRMMPWEWLVCGDRAIKADALDHCTTHDLVGCQDITWDIAAVAVEFRLSEPDTRHLCDIVQRESNLPVSPALLSFMLPCYLAFQLGAHAMAADALKDSDEEDRLRRAAARYAALLQAYL